MSTKIQNTKYRQVRMRDEEHKLLKLLSVARGETMSRIIGRMVRKACDEGGVETATRGMDAMEMVKNGRKFLSDTSNLDLQRIFGVHPDQKKAPIAPITPTP